MSDETCTVCQQPLWHAEQGHQACGACVRRLDQLLHSLAGPTGLYARLATVMQPGTLRDTNRVTGSRTAPLPIRLEPLSLAARGGVVTILQTWLVDIHEHLGWRHPRWEGDLQQQLNQAVDRLRHRGLLTWAAENHPAFAELYTEVRDLVAACRNQVSGEPPARRVTVVCPLCDATMRITLDTPGRRCTCGQQYGWAELRQLPLAERTAA
ncbi:hypothetical protein HMPREF1486_03119 [Streptomyces sp. HPH0547]|uniref:hypothetical protein n=1 Tax=Streptomyces sp. HPH0547 TaxID=1203592 RepID=UPI00034EA5C0|nr:hypothetical protein [Streptomyces sp. HPH0547]EPD94566.1 hypothetical protein HMPREF1486_03119 [Streptomyces sp. HPH0547]